MSKTALITGSSRGIGRAVALRLAKDNFNIIVNYVSNTAEAESLVSQLTSEFNVKAIAIKADVSDMTQCRELVDKSLAEFGSIECVVLNAGILTVQPLDQITPELFDKEFGVNVKGPLFLTQMLAPTLQPNSRIIFFSTNITTFSGVNPTYQLYAATKGAIEQLTRTFAKELGARGILVNCVAPGPTATDMFLNGKTEEQIEFFKRLSPVGRLGMPEDIAGLVAFLAGDDSKWVNGQTIRCSGGFVV